MEWKEWQGREVDGKFLLGQYLGESPHSAVFLTEYGDTNPQKAVIKLAPSDMDTAYVWMLRRELAARLSHTGLLFIFESGTCRMDGINLIYVVMEHSDEDLSQVIPTRPLAAAEAREVLTSILDTLEYLHAEGFVHGSLTPANVMAAGDRIKISSDTLLRIGESADDLAATNPNGPPEGRTGLTPASDVWSVGMTLVEILTQRPPRWDGNAANDPEVPRTIEAPFFDIALRCLRADPRLRCSLADIRLALQPPAPAPTPEPHPIVAVPSFASFAAANPPRPQMNKLAIAAASCAGVLVALLIGSKMLTPHAAPEASQSVALMHSSAQGPAQSSAQASVESAMQPVAAEKTEIVRSSPFQAEAAQPAAAKATGDPAPVATFTAPTSAPAPDHAADPAPDKSASLPSIGEVVDRVVPDVPPRYLRSIRGKVSIRVRITVDRNGAVTDAQTETRPVSKYFDRVALETARLWKFKPTNDAETTHLLHFECHRDGCEATAQ